MRIRKKKDVIEFIPSDKKVVQISEVIERSFSSQAIILKFIDVFLAFLLTLLIVEPLLAFAHLIRTQEWIFEIDILGFLIFIGFVSVIIIVVYTISKSLREVIKQQLKYERTYFYRNIVSIIFAFLVVDVFYEPLLAFSFYISSGFITFDYDLGILIDRIIASMILLAILLSYIGIMYQLKKRKK